MCPEYWDVRNSLNVVMGVVLYNHPIVVPSSLRNHLIKNLHSAHQAITSMTSHAMSTVFWPGITSSIEKTTLTCRTCHKNAPSQPKLPPRFQLPHFRWYAVTISSSELNGILWLSIAFPVGLRWHRSKHILVLPSGAYARHYVSCSRHLGYRRRSAAMEAQNSRQGSQRTSTAVGE